MLEQLSTPGPLLRTPGVRVLLRALPPGGEIPAHAHPGHEVLVTALSGELTLCTPGTTLTLNPGELARLDDTTPLALRAGPAGATFSVTLTRRDAPPTP
ncbi:cupin domain-containing protein [Deinococcus multiflagellatus]|uniref:Cupin domain-containing protein n=1 Tax=Deinococcus multiflagellatus TaxID=1656887 RepID=A0ABW1ZSG6_9DEIO|nr:cupin domain-containing protein [Deinococcus multiflagellatus]MBZ9713568.1 cupin domain-containing protein [Deinococcus multiflagellatus]